MKLDLIRTFVLILMFDQTPWFSSKIMQYPDFQELFFDFFKWNDTVITPLIYTGHQTKVMPLLDFSIEIQTVISHINEFFNQRFVKSIDFFWFFFRDGDQKHVFPFESKVD